MVTLQRLSFFVLLATIPSLASASDFSGIATMFIGIPALAGANIALWIFFSFSTGRTQKLLATAIFVPVAVAVIVLWHDALSLFHRTPDDRVIGIGFFSLSALLVLLFLKLLFRANQNGAEPVRDGL